MKWSLVTHDKKFTGFFWTQFLGAFNDNFFKNALVVLVTFRGITLMGMESEDLVAVVSGLLVLPFFMFSPLAGQFADKFEKSKLVRHVKLLEIAIMLVAAAGFLLKSYILLVGLIFMTGLQSAFFGPIKFSIIPDLVGEKHLTEGNALIELGTFLSILLGTIAGGLATSVPQADTFIGLMLIVIAIVGYFTARTVLEVPVADPNLKIQWNPFPEYLSLWRLLKERVAIFNSVLAISWFWFFGAGVLSVLPLYVKDFLLGNENVVTLFLAMFTLGVAIGSMLSEELSFGRVEIGLVPIGSAGLSVFLLDLYLVGMPGNSIGAGSTELSTFTSSFAGWRLMFDFFMMSVCGGIFIVPLYTLLQERSQAATRSRVIAGNNIVNAAFTVLAAVAVVVFYQLGMSQVEIFASFAVMNFLVCLYIYSVVPEFTLRFYAWILSRTIYSIKTVGLENVPKEGPFVLIANHVSYVDWMIMAGACKRPVSFVMYYKFFSIPIARYFMKQAKVIPIASRKENEAIMESAFEKISFQLRDQEGVCIFPEGTLTDNGELKPFKPGLLKILENDAVPVVPVVLHGLWGSIFSRKKDKDKTHRRPLTVEFHKPLSPDQIRMEDLEKFFESQLSAGSQN